MNRKNLLIILLSLAIHAAGLETASATCYGSPTANITTSPAALVLYTGESVQLSGATSIANCGSINEYRWRVRPVGGSYTTLYQGSTSTYNHTFTLSSGLSEQGYNVELRVRQSNGVYHTRTIQVTVTRNNKSLYYLTDHLGSVRVTVNERGDPVGWDDYYPFGLQMPKRSKTNPEDDTKFTGYELEQQGDLGLYHAGARMYDPEIGRFMSVDPHTSNYPSWSPYSYVFNNPINGIDPDGKDGILLVWRNYRADGYPFTGHAGILLIDNETGFTKYYEYGRYDAENFGEVRNYAVPNVELGEDGLPTQESLQNVLEFITKRSGRGLELTGAYFESDMFSEMNAYAQELMMNEDRAPYSTFSNNCGTFCTNVLKQDSAIESIAPRFQGRSPYLMINQYNRRADHTIRLVPGKIFEFNRGRGRK